MNTVFFPHVDTWRLPDDAFQASLEELRRDGRDGNEGVALWLGQRADGSAEISHVVLLRGPGVIKCPDILRIESWLLNDVTDLAIELGTVLVGQIHSHGRNWTDLSITDRADGIAVPQYLSVVAPYYGMRAGTRLADCGVHIFEPETGWRCLPSQEASARVRVVATHAVPVLSVGEEVS